MKYGMERLLNLGRFGIQFENIKLSVSDCDTREEAEQEIKAWKKDIENAFKKISDPHAVTFTQKEIDNLEH